MEDVVKSCVSVPPLVRPKSWKLNCTLFSEPDAAAANTLTFHTPDGKKGLTFNNWSVLANPVMMV